MVASVYLPLPHRVVNSAVCGDVCSAEKIIEAVLCCMGERAPLHGTPFKMKTGLLEDRNDVCSSKLRVSYSFQLVNFNQLRLCLRCAPGWSNSCMVMQNGVLHGREDQVAKEPKKRREQRRASCDANGDSSQVVWT